jgi:mannose-1-phosphate guanylyltransferase
VAFGIVPTHAEIGYGYIEKGLPIEHGFNIARFIEKPDQALPKNI